jgi:hypothetical protein
MATATTVDTTYMCGDMRTTEALRTVASQAVALEAALYVPKSAPIEKTKSCQPIKRASARVASGATFAFSQRPLCRTYHPFIGPISKGSSGST